MAGDSKVGNPGVYQADDQRNMSNKEEAEQASRFEEGQANSHVAIDSKDQRSINNRVAATETHDGDADSREVAALKKDPTAPAKMHGNKPSRGAEIDAEIQAEEEAMLANKANKK